MITCKIDEGIYNLSTDNDYQESFPLRRGQLEAIEKIRDEFGENQLFVAPTGYGKTAVAVYYIINMHNEGLKCIYTAPLKAFTLEITEKLNSIGLNVIEETGDNRKDPSKDYEKCDVVVATYERLDSVMRNPNNHQYFESFGLIIVDEIHTIHSVGRGVNLESLIVKLKLHTSMAIMGMSATVDNYDQMAEFLGCKAVYVPVEERPVKQKIEIMYYGGEYHNQTIQSRNTIMTPIFHKLIKIDKQALIFCSSRKRCEDLARDFSGVNARDPIEMAKRSNYSYHHAGLQLFQKKEIENLFKKGDLKFIFCTPTLAASVNLPAYCVIIYDTMRWSGLRSGYVLIDSMEIEQMIGRAGRPQFEKECEVFIFAPNNIGEYIIRESFVKSGIKDSLKSILNEWVLSGASLPEEIIESINETLLSKQLNVKEDLDISEAMDYLLTNSFIRQENGGFESTFLGKMTAIFYIQPETALHFKKLEQSYYEKEMTDLEITSNLINTEEFLDNIRVSERDSELMGMCAREFQEQNISQELYDEKILKVIPMVFTNYFQKKYNKKIIMYRTDLIELSNLMERLFSSAGVIIYNKEIKNRINSLKYMVKNRTLDKSIAILNSTAGIGDVRMNRLISSKIDSPEKFFRTTDLRLKKILKVSDKGLNTIKENLKRQITINKNS